MPLAEQGPRALDLSDVVRAGEAVAHDQLEHDRPGGIVQYGGGTTELPELDAPVPLQRYEQLPFDLLAVSQQTLEKPLAGGVVGGIFRCAVERCFSLSE